MSRRIFTKFFTGTVSVATAVPVVADAIQSWLAQEPIEVIGAEISLGMRTPSENDGFAFCDVELSQVGVHALDGAILVASAGEGWNTTPAGIQQANSHPVVTFPAGFTVPVKEEGYLYINVSSLGKSAGTSIFSYKVIVYYTKKGH